MPTCKPLHIFYHIISLLAPSISQNQYVLHVKKTDPFSGLSSLTHYILIVCFVSLHEFIEKRVQHLGLICCQPYTAAYL